MSEEQELYEDELEFEPGPHRQAGTAGPDGAYIIQSLNRWQLRGDGYLK